MNKSPSLHDAPIVHTKRLILRPWRPSDLEPFAAMNADSRVMEFFPSILTREQSDSLVERIVEGFDRHGFGLWAVEAKGVAPFIGFVGLSVPSFQSHFTPCVEVGWRIAFDNWGRGYATEGAEGAITFGFEDRRVQEIVSFTATINQRSRRVMEKLGMVSFKEDVFDHPNVAVGDRLCQHVLYRLTKDQWKEQKLSVST